MLRVRWLRIALRTRSDDATTSFISQIVARTPSSAGQFSRCLGRPPVYDASEKGSRGVAQLAQRVNLQATRPKNAERYPRCPPAPRTTAIRTDHPPKDIPVRYRDIVSRLQTAERHMRAVTEEYASHKSKMRSTDRTGSWAVG